MRDREYVCEIENERDKGGSAVAPRSTYLCFVITIVFGNETPL